MNELSLIFQALNIDTGDVLAAARTKWNFMPFQPGLVGGHCIGVDPYYLTYRAEKAGYHPEVILAGRRINDGMGQRIARECIRGLLRRKGSGGVVTVLGLTFKEDVPDTRNSRVVDVIRELQSFGLTVQVCDPMADPADAMHEYGVQLIDFASLRPADAVIMAVAHKTYIDAGWPMIQKLLNGGQGLVLDVKMKLERSRQPDGIELWRL
jgi:UDP-N-acetyl-D-galactosamine dehydrogenase